jgi:uncharacterized membrane protein YoaK (UPF0700 family)
LIPLQNQCAACFGADWGAGMLIHEGDERSVEIDVNLAAVLAAVAGAMNGAGFHAVGYYSANMTGNVSAFSDFLALGNPLAALLYFSIVIAFIFGAWTSSLIVNFGQRRGLRAVYAISILIEAGLLAALGLADLWLPGIHRSVVLIYGLSFVMGLQNAAATRISNGRVRTTHVSGMATDIGIELSIWFDSIRGRTVSADLTTNRGKLRLHTMTILAFVLGGVIGVLLYGHIGGGFLLIASALLVAVALPQLLKRPS